MARRTDSSGPGDAKDAPGAEPLPEIHFAAWASKVEAGEALDFAELLRAHPALSEELRRLHEDWKLFAPLLGKVVPGRISGESGIVIAPLSSTADETGEPPSPELLERLGIQAPASGRYRFRAVIGRGGGGVVLKVWDTKLNRPLAMKVVLGRGEERPTGQTPKVDGLTLTRFVDEARIASQLNHPGIVPVHDLGADESGRAFFTMKLVKGEDLSRVFEKVKTGEDGWNPTRALNVLLRVCESVAFAHEKGVIHRDLKPANVMIGRHGEVYVMDWGLARVLGEEDKKDVRVRPPVASSGLMTVRSGPRGDAADSPLYTMDGDVVGTPAYMAPEQAAGDLPRMGPHSDVYAVGAMLYHLLVGHMPYVPQGARLNNYAVWQRVQEGPPERIEKLAPSAPVELVAICEKAMAKEVAERYRDLAGLASDLRAFVEGRVVAAYETGTWAETRKWLHRNRPLAASLGAAILFLVAVLVTFLTAVSRINTEHARGNARLAAEKAVHAEESARLAVEQRVAAERSEERAHEDARVAGDLRARADENARLAEEAKRAAEGRESEALAAKKEARWTAYLASIRGAESAYRLGEAANLERHLEAAPEEYRGWEWRHLDSLRECSTLVLNGHTKTVHACTFSPDGTRILTASRDGTLRAWDVASGAALLVLPTGRVNVCAFTPEGMRILTAQDTTVRVWDAANGAELFDPQRRISTETISAGELGSSRACDLSADGTQIVTVSNLGVPYVWDTARGTVRFALRGHRDPVFVCSFSSDGGRILTASLDATSRVWDAKSGDELGVLPTGLVNACALSPDGTRVLTASEDGTAHVWDAARCTRLAVLRGHTGPVNACAFSPDGARVVTASSDTTARIWDAVGGVEIGKLLGHTSPVVACSFTSDGTLIVTGSTDGTARVWDAMSSAESIALRGHARLVATVNLRARGEWHVRMTGGTTVKYGTAYRTDGVLASIFSPDGARILTVADDQTARVWDAATGAELAVLRGHSSEVSTCAFSPDAARILTASEDGTARMWDATTGSELAVLPCTNWPLACAFTSDGARIATTSDDLSVRVWDIERGTELPVLPGRTDTISACAFSGDGAQIVTASSDGTVHVWDAASGVEVTDLPGHAKRVSACAFSPDGARIATASDDGTARVWDTASGTELATLRGHTSDVRACAFSPDGTRIVTGSSDGTARVWDAASGADLGTLRGHASEVSACAFSPDGLRIVTASGDGVARVWDSAPYSVRWRERQSLDAAMPQATAALEAVLGQSADLVDAGRRLQEDKALKPWARRAGFDLIMRRASEVRRRVEDLREKYLLGDAVVEAVHAETTLSPILHKYAIDAAQRLQDDPIWLNVRAWRIVALSDAELESYRRALNAAEVAARLDSELDSKSAEIVTTLGVAQYRCGRFAEAATTLERSRAMSENAFPDLAFLAMARFRLGEPDVANQLLTEVRDRLQADEARTDESVGFLREAETLIQQR